MSSLFSSILSYAGASLPVVFLAGLLWVTATVLDSDSSHSTRKRRVPGLLLATRHPLADDDAYASLVLALESFSLSTPEKKEVSYAKPDEEDKTIERQMEVNAGALVETPAETTFFQPEPAPLALAAATSLAAKLKFDGFRCGSDPLAAFSRGFQLAQPDPPLLVLSTPAHSDALGEKEMQDAPPVPVPSSPPVEHMVLDVKASQAAPSTKSSTTSTSPGILRKVSQITKQFVNLQIQSSPAPVDFSPLVEKMARWSLNDNQQTSKAQITQPTSSVRPRQIQHQIKSQPTPTPAPPPRTASQTASRQSPAAPSLSPSSSGQPSSMPAIASPAKTEKKQIISAPAQPPSSATPKPLPKSAAPATPQRPAGQLSLPAIRPKSLFAAARKPLPQVARPKSTASSSSGQPSPAKATAIPATAEKKEPTQTASSSQPLPQPAVPTQAATSSSSGQSSAPAQASAAKTETKKLATMGAVNSLLANMLDSYEAEETEAKAEKPAPKPAPKPETKPEPKPEANLDELSFEEIESQLALEEMELLKEEKEVPKYKGKDRKIAPLKRK
ncbi:hypothetical protein INS49_012476 [Diaporthe citri]|uniref:uncharacterized protein n=1 Tax=Diaporthe citri TaxID=83186 RepID=UPI001C7E9471|nr:uncharacterized protein INS49_012476 [Diaporthe citri]KAG6358956.1 hypothetical protein INS49_012476 [Diaporthe citri]